MSGHTMHRWDCPDPYCNWWREVPDDGLDYLWVMVEEHRAAHEESAQTARDASS